jgi:uncharacterized protein YodC (DUF2158 family)
MTVDKTPGQQELRGSDYKLEEYQCEWFKGATPMSGKFGDHLLKLYKLPSK